MQTRENHVDKGELEPIDTVDNWPPPNLTNIGIYCFIGAQRSGKTYTCSAMVKTMMQNDPDIKPILLCPSFRKEFSFIPKKQRFTNCNKYPNYVANLIKIQNKHMRERGYNSKIILIMDDLLGRAVFSTKAWKNSIDILSGSCRQPENNITIMVLVQHYSAIPFSMRNNIYKLIVGDTSKEECKKIANMNSVYNEKQLYNNVSTYCCNHQMLYIDNYDINDCFVIKAP